MEIKKLLSEIENTLARGRNNITRKSAQAEGAMGAPFPFKDKYTQAIDDFRDVLVLYAYVFAEINHKATQEWACELYKATADVMSWIEIAEKGTKRAVDVYAAFKDEIAMNLQHLLDNPPSLSGETAEGAIYDEVSAALADKAEKVRRHGYELYHILIGAA